VGPAFLFLFAWFLPEAARNDEAPILWMTAREKARRNGDLAVFEPFPA
jgi:hypothetical protein